jgi:5-methyltetrahydrofolate--homocysteine methyltransferase
METILKSVKKTVVISPEKPTVLVGERINPTGKKRLAAALAEGNLDIVRKEALAQVEAGADVDALRAALAVHREMAPEGKPLINSVNGEEDRLEKVLPLVAEYGTAVIGLAMDDEGIPNTSERRLAVARKIVGRAEALGIPRQDVVIDCLALTVGADSQAGVISLGAMRMVREELGVNMTLGASNVSFGLPDREVINWAFLAMAIQSGVNCPIVDAGVVRPAILASDLLLGRDDYAMRYIKDYKKRSKVRNE